MSQDTIYKLSIYAFIAIFVIGGTIIEFRKPTKKNEKREINKDDFNKIILESLKKEESENSNI